jgi:taurine dioxygenase
MNAVLNPAAQDADTQALQGLYARPLAPLGTEIIGLDLDQEIGETVAQWLRQRWVESGLLLFRGACRSQEAHLRLSRCFGELRPSATAKLNLDANPFLMGLRQGPDNRKADTYAAYQVGGQARTGWLGWHWDQSFTAEIVRGGVLRMIEPARLDGRTGFIDAIAAWDRLPPALQRRIDSLEVVYHFTGAQELNRFGFPEDLRLAESHAQRAQAVEKYRKDFPPVVHPLVITQRETGRRILKFSPMHAQYVLGMEQAASDALLHEVAGYLVDERHAYHHTWQADDVIVWDNWRIIHSASGVPLDAVRYAERTTLVGDYKLGRYLQAGDEPQQRRQFDD